MLRKWTDANQKGVTVEGPNEDFRVHIAERIDELEDAVDPEGELANILAQIYEVASTDEPAPLDTEADAYREMGAIDAWAGLASDAVQALYEPHSMNPFNKSRVMKGLPKIAGFRAPSPEWLRRIAGSLEPKLRTVCTTLRGTGFGIAVGFPSGISISISYTLTP